MSELRFDVEWQPTGAAQAEVRDSSAFLTLHFGDSVITRNEDVWSKTIRDSVLVSTYPLALWLAGSWWRLNAEPLPKPGLRPDGQWRMAHEMGAANQGYVWPHVVFASDNEVMQIWATTPEPTHEPSVRYLTACSATMPLEKFRAGVDAFIDLVLRRLAAMGQPKSDLAQLWQLVRADRDDPEASRYRGIEAALGYDPDDATEDLMHQASVLDREMGGGSSLTELAPLYGRSGADPSLAMLRDLRDRPGLVGKPAVPRLDAARPTSVVEPPWARAVAAARALRQKIGVRAGKIDSNVLLDLLGLLDDGNIAIESERLSGLGIPQAAGQIKFIPRKRHPVAKRFEYSRFVADVIQVQGASEWLTSTDLSTSRQKFQRAFAAEFLCPIEQLTAFLDGDYSETGIEDAADYFAVSERTVESLLANNGVVPASWTSDHLQTRAPY